MVFVCLFNNPYLVVLVLGSEMSGYHVPGSKYALGNMGFWRERERERERGRDGERERETWVQIPDSPFHFCMILHKSIFICSFHIYKMMASISYFPSAVRINFR